MLEKVRNPFKAKTIIAYIVFGAICLVFIFLGIGPGGLPLGQGGNVAIVNGIAISSLDVNERLDYEEKRLAAQLKGMTAVRRRKMTQVLKNRIQNNLIQVELTSQGAAKEGLVISDKELQRAIVDIPLFREDNRFKPSRYARYLEFRRIKAVKFEENIKKDLRVKKIQQSFTVGSQPSHWEIDQQIRASEWKLNIAFVALHTDLLKKNKGSKANAASLEEDKKALEKVKEIQQKVASSGSAQESLKFVNQFVKENSLDWESTGEFSVASQSIPVLGNKTKILEAALLLKQGQAHKEFLPVDGKYYFIRLKSLRRQLSKKQDFLQAQQVFNYLNSTKSQILFSQWLEKQKDQAKIIRSAQ